MADASASEEPQKLSLLKRLQSFLRNRPGVQMRESLQEVIEESDRENPALSEQERLMLANLLEFGELRVDDVMVPRADIVAVEEKTPLCDLVALFREAQHSRLPVYRETLDDPVVKEHVTLAAQLFEKEAEAATIRAEFHNGHETEAILNALLGFHYERNIGETYEHSHKAGA